MVGDGVNDAAALAGGPDALFEPSN